MNNQKIGFLINSLAYGGAEKVMVTIVEYLEKNHKENIYYLFLLDDSNRKINNDIDVCNLKKVSNMNILNHVSYSYQLSTIIKKHKINVVVSFLPRSNLVNIFSSFFNTKHKIIISERSNPKTLYSKYYFLNFIIKQLYKKANLIIAVSNGVANDLINNFQLSSKKIITINNPFNIKTIIKLSNKKCSNEWINNPKIKVVIGVGRLIKDKRFEDLIKAFSILDYKQNKYRLILIGEGENKKNISKLLSKLKLSNYVKIIPFSNNHYNLLANSNCLVSCSQREGFPNILVEAMLVKTQVISSKVKYGANEILQNGQYGTLYDIGNIKQLSKIIDFVLKNKNQLLLDNSFKYAKKYDVRYIAKDYLRHIVR